MNGNLEAGIFMIFGIFMINVIIEEDYYWFNNLYGKK